MQAPRVSVIQAFTIPFLCQQAQHALKGEDTRAPKGHHNKPAWSPDPIGPQHSTS
jgi:hypothetical protein